MSVNVFKIAQILIILGIFASDVLLFEFDKRFVLTALMGAISGSFVLSYFSRVRVDFWGKVAKSLTSAIASLFIGGVIVEYFQIEKLTYISFVFFTGSLLALVLLKALIDFAEKNATNLIVVFFKKFISIAEVQQEKKKGKDKKFLRLDSHQTNEKGEEKEDLDL